MAQGPALPANSKCKCIEINTYICTYIYYSLCALFADSLAHGFNGLAMAKRAGVLVLCRSFCACLWTREQGP